ncbi:vWA domain-containing protein [Thiohalorhabdus sp. Cl-TMA]|uniref:VWA domain-containing protein n=1 Tax=Thiohalorhabdus methylotrophus TaxID=3242694 RepID=A0ABV4U1L8_9GAMM
MSMGFEHPWLLAALLLGLLPWWRLPLREREHAWTAMLPRDGLSRIVDFGLRAAGLLAVTALLLGLGGPYLGQQTVERITRGAHIVLTLDRSRSMDQTFAGSNPQGGEESKSDTARRLLSAFIERREHDLFGVVTFSTRPMPVLPLTDDQAAVRAAVRAAATPGLAFTNVALGLQSALSYFEDSRPSASRAVVLLSDGAAEIDFSSAARLRTLFARDNVALYWIFLRTEGSPGLEPHPGAPGSDKAEVLPEQKLHRFFKSLDTPYHAYEAENPEALARAIEDIGRLESQPLVYEQRIPRQDLSGLFFGLAGALLLLLVAAKAMQRELVA